MIWRRSSGALCRCVHDLSTKFVLAPKRCAKGAQERIELIAFGARIRVFGFRLFQLAVDPPARTVHVEAVSLSNWPLSKALGRST